MCCILGWVMAGLLLLGILILLVVFIIYKTHHQYDKDDIVVTKNKELIVKTDYPISNIKPVQSVP